MANKKFQVTDDSVNSYGFRVLTAGIRTEKFEKNPVGYFNHQCGDDYFSGTNPEYVGPIIRWESLQKNQDGSMTAVPVFDMEDPVGAAVAKKVENDFIRAASIGFRILKTSDDPNDLLPGQKYPTVIECELVEISVVDIPANYNAICCFDADNKRINLSDESTLLTTLSAIKPRKDNPMKLKLTEKFPLLQNLLKWNAPEEGKEHEVEVTIDALRTSENEIARLSGENTTLSGEKTRLEGELSALKTTSDKATADLATANTEIDRLKAELGDKNATGRTVPLKEESNEGNGKKLVLTGDEDIDRELKARHAIHAFDYTDN